MSLLGISLYPHLQSEAVMKQQLNLAVTLGYSQVYTTVQSPQAWNGPTQLKPPFQWLIGECRKLGLTLHVDINRRVMEQVGAQPDDLSLFVRLGIRIIRLDFGFEEDHELVAQMTCNADGVLIEDNASMQAEPINRIKAIQRHGNLENYIAVHNFFPHPDTGMSFTDTFKNAKLFKACGIRTGVFINSLDADNLLFRYGHGLCTVENHRYKPAYLSAGELTATGMFDYIFFGDGNPSRTEMEQVQEIVHHHCVSVPVYFNSRLDDELRQKLLNVVLKSRSDQPEFILRATQTRGLGHVPAHPGPDRDKLCITLDNELSGKYEGELQIALKSMPGVEYATVIGQVDMLAENLISLIRYGKVAFRLVEAEKIQNATVGQEQTHQE